jgi:hypothetical protein
VTVIDRLDRLVDVGVGRRDHAHDVRPTRFRAGAQFHTTRPGHSLIGDQHDHVLVGLEDLQRLVGATGGEHVELVVHRVAEGDQVVRLIVDEQHGVLASIEAHDGKSSCNQSRRYAKSCYDRNRTNRWARIRTS